MGEGNRSGKRTLPSGRRQDKVEGKRVVHKIKNCERGFELRGFSMGGSKVCIWAECSAERGKKRGEGSFFFIEEGHG